MYIEAVPHPVEGQILALIVEARAIAEWADRQPHDVPTTTLLRMLADGLEKHLPAPPEGTRWSFPESRAVRS